jgi:hypothetical protein
LEVQKAAVGCQDILHWQGEDFRDAQPSTGQQPKQCPVGYRPKLTWEATAALKQ